MSSVVLGRCLSWFQTRAVVRCGSLTRSYSYALPLLPYNDCRPSLGHANLFSMRSTSASANDFMATRYFSNARKERKLAIEMSVRDITNRVIKMRDTLDGDIDSGLATSKTTLNASTWNELDKALRWWSTRGTVESVSMSFELLNSIVRVSEHVQATKASASVLTSEIVLLLTRNWLLVWKSEGEDMELTPSRLLEELDRYHVAARASGSATENLRPCLKCYHLLMEGVSIRMQSRDPTFNQDLLQRLFEVYSADDPSLEPSLLTIAYIFYDWSRNGQYKAPSELQNFLCETLDKRTEPWEVEEYMQDGMLVPTKFINSAMMSFSIAKDKNSDEKMQAILYWMLTLDDSEDFTCRPNLDTYHLVMNGLARAGKGAQAEVVLQDLMYRCEQQMQDQQNQEFPTRNVIVRPDTKTFTIVMTAYSNSDESRAAEKAQGILNWMKELNQDALLDCAPEAVAYNNVLRAWSWRRSEKAIEMCKALRMEMYKEAKLNPSVAPNAQTYGQSMKAIALSNSRDRSRHALHLMREMGLHGLEPDEFVQKYYDICIAPKGKKRYSKQ